MKEVRTQFDKRFGTIEEVQIFAIATILDPRFKKLYFKNIIACSKAINAINNKLVCMTANDVIDESLETIPETNKGFFSNHQSKIETEWKEREVPFESGKLHTELTSYLGKYEYFY